MNQVAAKAVAVPQGILCQKDRSQPVQPPEPSPAG